MSKTAQIVTFLFIIIAVLAVVSVVLTSAAGKPGKLDSFASCLKDKGAEGYPTWHFADGERESGEISLERLAEKTGCSLPKE